MGSISRAIQSRPIVYKAFSPKGGCNNENASIAAGSAIDSTTGISWQYIDEDNLGGGSYGGAYQGITVTSPGVMSPGQLYDNGKFHDVGSGSDGTVGGGSNNSSGPSGSQQNNPSGTIGPWDPNTSPYKSHPSEAPPDHWNINGLPVPKIKYPRWIKIGPYGQPDTIPNWSAWWIINGKNPNRQGPSRYGLTPPIIPPPPPQNPVTGPAK
jgi:hypothetical protein